MPFTRAEAENAHNLIDEIDTLPEPPDSPFTKFTLCWGAFNNIYSILTRLAQPNATTMPPDFIQIDHGRRAFPPALKFALLTSNAFKFFLGRVPHWQGHPVPADANGVFPNGVINIAKSEYKPVLEIDQIDRVKYASWLVTPVVGADCDELVRQIVKVVYTVRNNTVHGRKVTTDDNALIVVDNAYVLVRIIVDALLIR